MNEQPIPYEHPGRRSRVTVVKGAEVAPVTLTPLIKGLVTGTLGNVPLSSGVYGQIDIEPRVDESIAWVRFNDSHEVLGLKDGHVVRCRYNLRPRVLAQLILTDGAR
ncbi:hypothetical protein [Arthrobacter sp. PAMC25284]|uniref:hypothetical protein n=1 Tax=Arthrobacter sp. PAMC25284 TaxID=2861279 RepID=UPI001C62DB4B|nr:hypothetical protein [Arthrobacter sp. PAMC25284]QYF88549.1 hypothetical protein KY499_09720 [Arthrobacter sp. PAMC25284]